MPYSLQPPKMFENIDENIKQQETLRHLIEICQGYQGAY